MSDWKPPSPPPKRNSGVSEAEIDGELVLLNTSTGAMHVLNRVAAAVWSELDGTRDVDALAASLSEAAAADLTQVRRDVARLIEELGRAGLLGS